MAIGFTHQAVAHIMNSIGAADTEIELPFNEYGQILTAPDDVYLLFRGPVNRELIKVDISASLWGSFLKIVRGQGGTSAHAWPMGSMLFATTHADHYSNIIQRGANRTIDYNPNQVLTPVYAGEKVWQNSPVSRWWKSFNGVDPYWDLITGDPDTGEDYIDIGWTYNLLMEAGTWEVRFDNTYFEAGTYGTWNAGGWWDSALDGLSNQHVRCNSIGGWTTNYRPTKIRVSCDPSPTGNMQISLVFVGQASPAIKSYGSGLISGTEFDIPSSWFDTYGDFDNINFDQLGSTPFKITNMEWYVQ